MTPQTVLTGLYVMPFVTLVIGWMLGRSSKGGLIDSSYNVHVAGNYIEAPFAGVENPPEGA